MHKYRVGQKVKVVVENPNYSSYAQGDVVEIVSILSGTFYRCTEDGRYYMNIQEEYLESVDLITIPLPTDGEQTQALLKELGMEDQMLRQLIMSMPFDMVETLYLERKRMKLIKIQLNFKF